MKIYENSLQHLQDELRRIELIVYFNLDKKKEFKSTNEFQDSDINMLSIIEKIVSLIRSVSVKKVIMQNKKTDEKVTNPPIIEKPETTMTNIAVQIEKTKSDECHVNRSSESYPSSDLNSQEGDIFKSLIDELHRIDSMIRNHLEKWKKEHGKSSDDFMGLYITEDEVSTILHTPKKELDAGYVNEKIQVPSPVRYESLEKDKSMRLQNLQKMFHLHPFEVEALLICLASELDMRYEKIYAYLQNDVMKKRATVNLVINLLCPSLEGRLKAREYFSPESRLIRNRLIRFTGDTIDVPLISRSIRVDERIVSYLLGFDDIDPGIRNFSYKIETLKSLDDLIFPEEEKNALRELLKHSSGIRNPIFFFHGGYGTGKKMVAEAICRELGMPLLVVDSRVMIKADLHETITIIIREALLQNSSLYLENFDAVHEKEAGVNLTGLFHELDSFPNWIFLAGETPFTPSGNLINHSFIEMAFPIPSFTFRKKLWEILLEEKVSDLDIDALSSKFNFSGGQIKDSISSARNFALARNPADIKLNLSDIYRGCKAQSNKNLSSFAKNIPPRYTWEDIVLPKDLKEQLKEVSGSIKHKGEVYTDWGFDAKLSLGKGLNILFSGPSGAGKTMAAEVLAKDAGLDIYKIDLSTVVSKYIGETEKALKKIFFEAETSNAILFFDEADALFGKRSEVKDSHDRYANIEINYLLQKMEEHEGIVILASNFKTNIDEAFLRRMHFVIEFPLPDDVLRERIWRNVFPEEAPVDKPSFYICDIKNAQGLRTKLHDARDSVSQYITEHSNMQQLTGKSDEGGAILNLKKNMAGELNKLISNSNIFDDKRFSQVKLREDTKRLLENNPEGDRLILLNRLLLEDAYPWEIGRSCLDFNFLSKFKLSGGNIKNIALSAAFLAAEDSCAIRMEHVIRATKREFQKIGRLCTPGDFGEYYELVK